MLLCLFDLTTDDARAAIATNCHLAWTFIHSLTDTHTMPMCLCAYLTTTTTTLPLLDTFVLLLFDLCDVCVHYHSGPTTTCQLGTGDLQLPRPLPPTHDWNTKLPTQKNIKHQLTDQQQLGHGDKNNSYSAPTSPLSGRKVRMVRVNRVAVALHPNDHESWSIAL